MIIPYPFEATEYTAEDVQTYLCTRTSGVYSDEITFTPKGMTVTVSPFLAWFNYAKFKGCSVAVTEPETLTFSPAHAALDRIDRIVLRIDFTLNRAYLTIVEGEPSSTPVPPNINKSEVINDISPVYVKIKAGTTEITHADITSTILDENVCGIMRDGVTGIPTAQLQAQVKELILRLHEAIDRVQEGSDFMLGDVYDPKRKAKPVAFKDEVLPLAGGDLTGNIYVESTLPHIGVANTDWREKGYADSSVFLEQRGTGLGTLLNYNQAGDYLGLAIGNIAHDATMLPVIPLGLRVKNNTFDNTYTIFGKHNKPSGSYTGNGAKRTINIGGIGKCVYIYASDGTIQAFATDKTGFGWEFSLNGSATDIEIVNTDVSYTDGYLYILNSSNDSLNARGVTYYYQVL